MSDQTNGLRFDVYERVHLPDDMAAIEELEEIELVPRIQVIEQGDQAILKGQLLLNGVYRGQNKEDAPLVLEHWIPVEISLPMNRVSQLDDISIEIDNFDVDLLSARTLNITGVLSLRGIITEPSEEPQAEWGSETFIAVHEREFVETETEAVEEEVNEWEPTDELARDEETMESTDVSADGAADAAEDETADQSNEQSSYIAVESFDSHWSTPSIAYEESGSIESESLEERESFIEQQYESWQAQPAVLQSTYQPELQMELTDVQDQEGTIERQAEPERESQTPNINLTINSPATDDAATGQAGVGLLSILESSKREQAVREAAEQSAVKLQEEAELARIEEAEDDIEWKNLFLSKKADEREFSKIRVCIVQKEETLEQIAMRYSLNPRDLLIHNRLHESAIAEGQLLYIP